MRTDRISIVIAATEGMTREEWASLLMTTEREKRSRRTQSSRQIAKALPARVQVHGGPKALPPAGTAMNVRAVPPRGPRAQNLLEARLLGACELPGVHRPQ